MNRMNCILLLASSAVMVALSGCQSTNSSTGELSSHAKASASDHRVVTPDQLDWKPAPPSLPPGATAVILEGDPKKDGFFAMRIRLPDGYRIPPHWHPNYERVTVLSGTFHLGHGETFDPAAAQAMPAGSYSTMPPGMRHFAYVTGATEIQLATLGPWAVNYINPSDDPRHAATTRPAR